jgi:hypothetical protein
MHKSIVLHTNLPTHNGSSRGDAHVTFPSRGTMAARAMSPATTMPISHLQSLSLISLSFSPSPTLLKAWIKRILALQQPVKRDVFSRDGPPIPSQGVPNTPSTQPNGASHQRCATEKTSQVLLGTLRSHFKSHSLMDIVQAAFLHNQPAQPSNPLLESRCRSQQLTPHSFTLHELTHDISLQLTVSGFRHKIHSTLKFCKTTHSQLLIFGLKTMVTMFRIHWWAKRWHRTFQRQHRLP